MCTGTQCEEVSNVYWYTMWTGTEYTNNLDKYTICNYNMDRHIVWIDTQYGQDNLEINMYTICLQVQNM